VDGVVCVPPDLDAFMAFQAAALVPGAPPLDPSAGTGFCADLSVLDPASEAYREARLLGQHSAAQHPEACRALGLADELAGNVQTMGRLADLARSHPLPPDAPVPAILDVGCGTGRMAADLSDVAQAGSVGMDLRVSLLRVASAVSSGWGAQVGFRSEGTRFEPLAIPAHPATGPVRFVQGDILAPPFPAESFAAVVAVSLLDTVHDPLVALGQLDALLAPGGLLLLATPWQWEPTVTPPDSWFATASSGSGEYLRTALAGQNPVLPHLSYELLAECDLPWALPGHRRLVHRYSLDTVLARKGRAA
jgi:SAM-dependent methyltransferase